ncbi:MAG: hypothetical protein AAFY71_18820 [Bacteroidota bacterium]
MNTGRQLLKTTFVFAIMMMLFSLVFSQQEILDEVNQNRIQLSKVGMSVLGSWAVGNMVFSGIQRSRTTGVNRYFHEMNVFWNVVNLGLAAGGLYGALTEDASGYSLLDTYTKQQSIEKIFLFNMALNGTYMTAGAWMRERSKSFTGDQLRMDRFKGYGNSLILQGGFLLLFDATNFFLHHYQAAPKLEKVLSSISVGSQGIGMVIRF